MTPAERIIVTIKNTLEQAGVPHKVRKELVTAVQQNLDLMREQDTNQQHEESNHEARV